MLLLKFLCDWYRCYSGLVSLLTEKSSSIESKKSATVNVLNLGSPCPCEPPVVRRWWPGYLTVYFWPAYLVTHPKIPIPIFAQYWVFITLVSSVIFIMLDFLSKNKISAIQNFFDAKLNEISEGNAEVDTLFLIFVDGAKMEERINEVFSACIPYILYIMHAL